VPWATVGAAGPDQRTPNIAPVIQEIVSRAGWSSGNALAIIITGNGERVAESYDGDPAGAPLLHIDYAEGGPPVNQPPAVDAGPDQAAVTLPDGASLNGTVSDDGLPNPPATVTTIWSQQSGSGTVTFGDPNAIDTTASFSAAGRYVLRLTADDGELTAYDELTVTVHEEGSVNSVDVRVTTSADDAEESATGNVDLTSSDLELVYSGGNQTVGMRFQNVSIPQGATIVQAYLQFQVDEVASNATALTIQGQDVDNAPTFVASADNISSRTRTSAAIAWSPPPWTTVGQAGPDQRTPDIAAVVQEIVTRTG